MLLCCGLPGWQPADGAVRHCCAAHDAGRTYSFSYDGVGDGSGGRCYQSSSAVLSLYSSKARDRKRTVLLVAAASSPAFTRKLLGDLHATVQNQILYCLSMPFAGNLVVFPNTMP